MRHRLLAWNSAGQMELLKDYHAMFCFGLRPPEPEKVAFLGQIFFRIIERTNKPIDSSAFKDVEMILLKIINKVKALTTSITFTASPDFCKFL